MSAFSWVYVAALAAAMGTCFYGMDGRSARLEAIGGGAWALLAVVAVIVATVRIAT